MIYLLHGEYEYPGNVGEFYGRIDIGPEGVFDGKVADTISAVRSQRVLGQVREENGLMRLAFIKSAGIPSLADILYGLERTEHGIDIGGTYLGNYQALPRNIPLGITFDSEAATGIVLGFLQLTPEFLPTSAARVELRKK